MRLTRVFASYESFVPFSPFFVLLYLPLDCCVDACALKGACTVVGSRRPVLADVVSQGANFLARIARMRVAEHGGGCEGGEADSGAYRRRAV